MKRARNPDQLRAAIDARGLTLREVALLCECSDGTVRFVLAGRNLNPELARRLARVVRGRVDDLFEAAPSSNEQANVKHEAVA